MKKMLQADQEYFNLQWKIWHQGFEKNHFG
jgi:hypothetical protein